MNHFDASEMLLQRGFKRQVLLDLEAHPGRCGVRRRRVFPARQSWSIIYKTKGLRVLANDWLLYCHHAAREIIEYCNARLPGGGLEMRLAEKR
ncbi:MAG: hypothetical protein ACE15F_10215 [bacterium]